MTKRINPDKQLVEAITRGFDFYLPDPKKSQLENEIINYNRRQKLIDYMKSRRNYG